MLLLWVSTALRPRRPPGQAPEGAAPDASANVVISFDSSPAAPQIGGSHSFGEAHRRTLRFRPPSARRTANPAVTVRFDLPDNGKERKRLRPAPNSEPDGVSAAETRTPTRASRSGSSRSKADIAIYGGAAGGGKTWALLLQPAKHEAHADFSAVFFRRTTVQIRNPGGLWDESFKLYTGSGAEPFSAALEWRFPSGAKVRFAHLEHEKTVLEWQGAQAPLICFDELTHFTAAQFWSMTARNRSVGLVKPYIRATCNPDADSWVAELIAWWIDQETGLPIRSRNGKLRWFVRVGRPSSSGRIVPRICVVDTRGCTRAR